MTAFSRLISDIDRFAVPIGPFDDPDAWIQAQENLIGSLDVSQCIVAIEHYLKVYRKQRDGDVLFGSDGYLESAVWIIGHAIERLRDSRIDDLICKLLRRGVGIRFVLELACYTRSPQVHDHVVPFLEHAVCRSNRTILIVALAQNANPIQIEYFRQKLTDPTLHAITRLAVEQTILEWQSERDQTGIQTASRESIF